MRRAILISLTLALCTNYIVAQNQTATLSKTIVSSSTWATNPVIATSTQQNAIAEYENFVFLAYYNSDRKLCIARNSNYGEGDASSWKIIELPHTYEMRNGVWDNHNTPNIIVSPNDGRIHLSFDMHAGNLRYIISDPNAAAVSDENFEANLFSSTRDYLVSSQVAIERVTYPRFFVGSNDQLFFMYRVGGSGNGDTFLARYKDDGFWNEPVEIIDGNIGSHNGSGSRCAYFNQVHYMDGRIYLTWVWRETSNGATNHDIMFVYSDNDGLSWRSSDGTTLTNPMHLNSPGITIATIPTNSGLSNHNGASVDGHGNIHVVNRHNGSYIHNFGIRNGDRFTWSQQTITSFSGDRPKFYSDQKTNDLYFLVRQGNSLRFWATASNDEKWDQWTEIKTDSDLYMTSGNSYMNAEGNLLTSMAVSTNGKMQVLRWALTTDSPEIEPKEVEGLAAPTDIFLSSSLIPDGSDAGTVVGILSVADTSTGDTHTYEFEDDPVEGVDNAAFTLLGTALKIQEATDVDTKSTYRIKLKVTDATGLEFKKAFVISVYSNRYTNDGIYAIQGAPQSQGSEFDKFISNPGAIDVDVPMVSSIAMTGTQWIVKENGDHFNIISLDDQFLLSSDGGRGVLIENTEVNRNSTDGGALVDIIDQETGLRFETNTASRGLRAWNSRKGSAEARFVGMGTSALDGYFWSLIRLADLAGAPTDIALSASAIDENNDANAAVATLSATDDTAEDTFTYEFETDSDKGADNDSFIIDGDILKINVSADYEAQSEYKIKVKVTDASGLVFRKALIVTVNDVNEAPTAIALSSESIAENEAIGSAVGTLSATDPDANSTFTYTLGGADAASFSIDVDQLKSEASFDFETKASYSITVTVSDGELTFDQDFTVAVEDVYETPLSVDPKFEMRVYPNPASDIISVEAEGLRSLKLLDLGGRVLLEKRRGSELNVESFPNGLYLLEVQTSEGTDVRKVVVNH